MGCIRWPVCIIFLDSHILGHRSRLLPWAQGQDEGLLLGLGRLAYHHCRRWHCRHSLAVLITGIPIVRVNSVTLHPKWWSFPQAVWFTARTTTRTRMAVCRTRTRITIRRIRTRISGPVSQTTRMNKSAYNNGDVSAQANCSIQFPTVVPRETSHSNSSHTTGKLKNWMVGRVW